MQRGSACFLFFSGGLEVSGGDDLSRSKISALTPPPPLLPTPHTDALKNHGALILGKQEHPFLPSFDGRGSGWICPHNGHRRAVPTNPENKEPLKSAPGSSQGVSRALILEDEPVEWGDDGRNNTSARRFYRTWECGSGCQTRRRACFVNRIS
jgi:hypothetical protein